MQIIWDGGIITGDTKNFLMFHHNKCKYSLHAFQVLSAFNHSSQNIKLPCCQNTQPKQTFQLIAKEVDCLLCPKKLKPDQKIPLKNGFSICLSCLKKLTLLIKTDDIKPKTTESFLKQMINSCSLCSALITLMQPQPTQNDQFQSLDGNDTSKDLLKQNKVMSTEIKKLNKKIQLKDQQLKQQQDAIRQLQNSVKQQSNSIEKDTKQQNGKMLKTQTIDNQRFQKKKQNLIGSNYTSPNFLKSTSKYQAKAVSQIYEFSQTDQCKEFNTEVENKTENSFQQSLINTEKQNKGNADMKSEVQRQKSLQQQSVQFCSKQDHNLKKNQDQMNSKIGTQKDKKQANGQTQKGVFYENEDSQSSGSSFSHQTEAAFRKQSSIKEPSPGSRLSLSCKEEPQVIRETVKPKFSNKVQTKSQLTKTSPAGLID